MEIVADKLCWEGGEFKAEFKKRGRVRSRLESRGVFCLLYTCTDSEVLVLMKLFSGILLFFYIHVQFQRGGAVMNDDPWIDFKSSRVAASCSDVKAKSGGLEPEVMVHVDYVPRSRRSGGM